MHKQIILKGYYGYGNLGDDILMLTTYGWVRENFRDQEILICSDSDHAQYISKLIKDDVSVVKSDEKINAEWIIHGGGGVYFDFKNGGSRFLILNKLIKAVGFRSFRKLYRLYRTIRRNNGVRSRKRAGIGIGIGGYTPSSKRFYADIVELSEYDFLMVRDEESAAHFRKLKLSASVHVSTDLAFLQQYWKKTLIKSQQKKVGFILRDWIYDGHAYFSVMKEIANQLQAEGYIVCFYSFDRNADTNYIKEFSEVYPFITWNPNLDSVDFFLEKLSECSLVITSRAHGAIISACLGVPSLCLGIEPKLEKISLMLKHSSFLIKQPFNKENVISVAQKQLENKTWLAEAALRDASENADLIMKGLSVFKTFVNRTQ